MESAEHKDSLEEGNGRSKQLRRIDGRYIMDEVGSVLSFRKGVLFTAREVLLRPGQSVRQFLREDRQRLVKPVLFVIFCSFVYAILQQLLRFEDPYLNYETSGEASTALLLIQWIQANYGYANLIMSVFIVLWVKLFFMKHDYNFFEVLTLVLYVIGIVMLISSIFGAFDALIGWGSFYVGGLLTFLYFSWAIAKFYDGNKVLNFIKALLSYLFGIVTATVLAVLLGILIDSI